MGVCEFKFQFCHVFTYSASCMTPSGLYHNAKYIKKEHCYAQKFHCKLHSISFIFLMILSMMSCACEDCMV